MPPESSPDSTRTFGGSGDDDDDVEQQIATVVRQTYATTNHGCPIIAKRPQKIIVIISIRRHAVTYNISDNVTASSRFHEFSVEQTATLGAGGSHYGF